MREVDEGGRDVAANQLVEGSAEGRDELTLSDEFGGTGGAQPVLIGDEDGDEFPT